MPKLLPIIINPNLLLSIFSGVNTSYLLIFTKADEAIVKRLENEKNKKIDDEKFSILLKGLDQYEQQIMKAIKEQDGITQNTLRLRTQLSKAKVSQVVAELEQRKLIKRIKQNKTFAIHLAIKL